MQCPLELWFPKRLYELFCAMHYVEGSYPGCQYSCFDNGNWIVCQRVGEEMEGQTEPEKPVKKEVKSLKEFIERL